MPLYVLHVLVSCPSNVSTLGGRRVDDQHRGGTVPLQGAQKEPTAGALLGGAGCSLTRSCKDLEAAERYLTWLHTPKVMAGDYFAGGGQPGSYASREDDPRRHQSSDGCPL